MSNLSTMVEEMSRLLGVSSTVRSDELSLCIIEAIKKVGRNPFDFNVADLAITPTVIGERVVSSGTDPGDFPSDLLYIYGESLYILDTAQTDDDRTVMISVSSNYAMDELVRMNPSTNDRPRYFAHVGKDLHVHPSFDLTTYKIVGRYIKDLGAPSKTWDGTSWTFGAGGEAWFEGDGYEIIVNEAAGLFRSKYEGAMQGAAPFHQAAAAAGSSLALGRNRQQRGPIESYWDPCGDSYESDWRSR